MASEIADLHVRIVRFVMDHQPPIVACDLADASGRTHAVIDKVWIFSEQTLGGESQYPQHELMHCAVLAWPRGVTPKGRKLVRIDTANPDAIESSKRLTEFFVGRDQVSRTGTCQCTITA